MQTTYAQVKTIKSHKTKHKSKNGAKANCGASGKCDGRNKTTFVFDKYAADREVIENQTTHVNEKRCINSPIH